MKSASSLRIALRLLALAAAFGSGWVFHIPPPASPTPILAGSRPRSLERDIPGSTVAKVGTARPAPDSRAVSLAREAETLDARGALAALRALEIPGNAAGTPLEKHLLMARFAAADPLTALTYIDTLPAGERSAATATVMGAWAAQDPQAAAAHLEEEAGGFGLSESAAASAAQAVAGEWSRRDPQGAAAWAAELPDELRPAALTAAAGQLAAQNPAEALQFLNSLPDDISRAEAATPLAAQWAAVQPSAASAWAVSLPDPDTRAAALSGVTAAWMNADPAAASRWVDALPAGSGKDAAILALTTSVSLRNDPDAALAWAASLAAPIAREQAVAAAKERLRLRDALR